MKTQQGITILLIGWTGKVWISYFLVRNGLIFSLLFQPLFLFLISFTPYFCQVAVIDKPSFVVAFLEGLKVRFRPVIKMDHFKSTVIKADVLVISLFKYT